ncbi:MNIO family bufferin maturase [Algihabitans albus]|uniref:MNIO family bufferin maturase n=1 Tax=Algihabitans albus TaxID=2164067 RepID=UPI000E5C9991|nr:DUF692 domain-containing protein [Algihabitans albus]
MTAFAPLGRTDQGESRTADPIPVAPIPAAAGIGLRHPHLPDFLNGRPPVAWLEVHSENFLSEGGPRRRALEAIRRDYPISCHGVGLSLGSAEGLSEAHLARLAALFDAVQPGLVSEHVAWSVDEGTYLNDLLPLPYTEEALAVLCRNIERAQEVFGRRILVENPSSYLQFDASRMGEAEFLAETVRRSGCGLLLDVNNIVVSAENHGFDPIAYLDALPLEAVGEIHVAGHAEVELEGHRLLIDDHGSRVPDAVWHLLEAALERTNSVPVLVEWDTAIPELSVLLEEAATAQRALERLTPRSARRAG